MREAIIDVRTKLPFQSLAWVLLPDHLHARQTRREGTIWQRRFWEHLIRDETDLERHVDYIHYNPVKHGYLRRAADWPYSTFHRYVRDGVYPTDWGSDDEPPHSDFGE